MLAARARSKPRPAASNRALQTLESKATTLITTIPFEPNVEWSVVTTSSILRERVRSRWARKGWAFWMMVEAFSSGSNATRRRRAAVQLHAAADPAARRHHHRPDQAALHHHRPACQARSRDRRVQDRQPGGRRTGRRPSGLFRRLPARSASRPDDRRRHARRGGVRARGDTPAPRRAQALRHRQLPGRLGDAAARRDQPRPDRPDRAQRRADRTLGRRGRRQPDALQRGGERRHLAADVLVGPRRWRLRRRSSGDELRDAEPKPQLLQQVLRPVQQGGFRARTFPGIRTLVGRLLPPERGRDPLDRRAAVRRQPPGAQHGAARTGAHRGHQERPRAGHRLRQPWRQHHPAATGAELDRPQLRRCPGNPHPRPAHHLHAA